MNSIREEFTSRKDGLAKGAAQAWRRRRRRRR